MASDRQIAANRHNAKKGGVKTAEGKAISRWNSLKHGLLAREVVIDAGDGKESWDEFDALLRELTDDLHPVGFVENMLVGRMAESCWRRRRAIRCEKGMIRSALDHYKEDSRLPYNNATWKFGADPEDDVYILNGAIKYFEDPNDTAAEHIDPRITQSMSGINLDIFYNDLIPTYEIEQQDCFRKNGIPDSVAIHDWLLANGWTFNDIKAAFIQMAKQYRTCKREVVSIERIKEQDRLSQIAQERALHFSDTSELLIRYESALNKEMYRALHELERLQRARRDMHVPAQEIIDASLHLSAGA